MCIRDSLEEVDKEISQESILNFHLAHRTNPEFSFEPNKETPKLIWKYLSTSNLLYNIKDIEITDIDKISTIEKETNEYPWSSNNFQSSMEAGNSSIVLKNKKNILGYAFFSVIGTDSHLLNITVSKNYQGRGYGKKILEKVLFQSKILGASIVFLEVRVSNYRAIDFYEKFGFKRDAIRYNYYDGSPNEDALLMSKQGL